MLMPNPKKSQTSPYFSESTSVTPVRTATQDASRSKIQNDTNNTFLEAINQTKSAVQSLNPNSLYGMSEADAIKYTKSSIADLEQKMANLANLSSFGAATRQQTPGSQISANNTNVQNSVSHVTNVTADYLRNIRGEYQKMPQWRTETG